MLSRVGSQVDDSPLKGGFPRQLMSTSYFPVIIAAVAALLSLARIVVFDWMTRVFTASHVTTLICKRVREAGWLSGSVEGDSDKERNKEKEREREKRELFLQAGRV